MRLLESRRQLRARLRMEIVAHELRVCAVRGARSLLGAERQQGLDAYDVALLGIRIESHEARERLESFVSAPAIDRPPCERQRHSAKERPQRLLL